MEYIITVVVPVYNAEKYLNECIQSVLDQSDPRWNLILVDDGSSDLSAEICDTYAKSDKRISVIHKKNEGAIMARRDGFLASKTEFCISLDADDYLANNCIQKIIAAIETYQADIVIYSFSSIKGDKILPGVPPLLDVQGIVEADYVKGKLISTNDYNSLCTKAIRSCYLKDNPLYYQKEIITIGEDKVQFLYPLTQAKRIAIVPDVLYFYRTVEGSMTHIYTAEKLIDRMGIKMFDYLYAYMQKWKKTSNKDMLAMSAMFWRSIVGIYNILQSAHVKEEDYKAVCEYDFCENIPNYIISYWHCPTLTCKEKMKIWLLVSHHTRLMSWLNGTKRGAYQCN